MHNTPAIVSLPPVQNIHGWSDSGDWGRVKQLQKATAEALGMPVVFRDQLKNGSQGPEMVVIPAGSYLMGSPENEPQRDGDEGPQHEVTIGQPFAIGKYEITTEEYLQCVESGGCRPPVWMEKEYEYRVPADSDSNHEYEGLTGNRQPIVGVSWEDALAYAQWLSDETCQAYRLPSEAEWEYAARAGTSTPFYTGTHITPDQANYYYSCLDGRHWDAGVEKWPEKTAPVGSYPPNPFGLFDMVGNVWELVQDCWHDNYEDAPRDGSAWVSGNCKGRVLRGGSLGSMPWCLRSAQRNGELPGFRCNSRGFRLVRVVTSCAVNGKTG